MILVMESHGKVMENESSWAVATLKELKTALKNAREAVRAKEYKEALKHCKAILKHEKANYNALVLVGVAAEGLDQENQALMAYNKTTQVDPEQQLAWQGLCSFYEKLSKEKHLSSLSEVYAKLLTFQQEDIAKYKFICQGVQRSYFSYFFLLFQLCPNFPTFSYFFLLFCF